MHLKRSIYNQLLDWKKDSFHRILEVSGARQAGKTYIINRFAEAERAVEEQRAVFMRKYRN